VNFLSTHKTGEHKLSQCLIHLSQLKEDVEVNNSKLLTLNKQISDIDKGFSDRENVLNKKLNDAKNKQSD